MSNTNTQHNVHDIHGQCLQQNIEEDYLNDLLSPAIDAGAGGEKRKQELQPENASDQAADTINPAVYTTLSRPTGVRPATASISASAAEGW